MDFKAGKTVYKPSKGMERLKKEIEKNGGFLILTSEQAKEYDLEIPKGATISCTLVKYGILGQIYLKFENCIFWIIEKLTGRCYL